MKKLMIIPIILLVIMSCSKSDSNETNIPPELIGKWRIISDSGIPVLNGGILYFKPDNTFTSTLYSYYPNYIGGNYTISSSNEITLTYNQSTNNLPDAIRTSQIVLLSLDRLTLNPTDLDCTEGCYENYKKVIKDVGRVTIK